MTIIRLVLVLFGRSCLKKVDIKKQVKHITKQLITIMLNRLKGTTSMAMMMDTTATMTMTIARIRRSCSNASLFIYFL